jgi:PST family polysaccharide transporter
VGAVGGAPVLGLYDGAKRWAWAPFLELWLGLSDAAVASLSRARHDPMQYRTYYRNLYLPIYSVALPAIVFTCVEARAVVLLVLGDQWAGAVPYLQLLSVAAAAASLSRLAQWVYLSTGETRRQLRWTLVTTPLMLLALAAGLRFGALGVAAGFTAGTVALAVPTAANALRTSPVTVFDCLAVYGRPFVAAVAAAAMLLLAAPILPTWDAPLAQILVRLPLFVLAYALGWVLLPGGRVLARDMVRALATRRLERDERDDASVAVLGPPVSAGARDQL